MFAWASRNRRFATRLRPRGSGRTTARCAAAIVVVAASTLAISSATHVASRDPIARLAAAVAPADRRPAEGRLIGFAWAPPPEIFRTNRAQALHASAVYAAVEELTSAVENRSDPAAAHARGVATLVTARAEEAVKTLRRACAADRRSARCWSDLSAAESARAAALDDVEGFALALVAADRGLAVEPDLPAAHFNRAIALEALRLHRPARDAYRAFVIVEPASEWSTEARERMRKLEPRRRDEWRAAIPKIATDAYDVVSRFPQETRTWGETEFLREWAEAARRDGTTAAPERARATGNALMRFSGESLLHDAVAAIDGASPAERASLADAQLMYCDARQRYGQREVEPSLVLLRTAYDQFTAARSPMAFAAAYYAASALTDLGRVSEAAAMLDIVASAPARYRAQHAHVAWLRGTLASRAGRVHEALKHYQSAANASASLGEREYAATAAQAAATALAALGETAESWRMRRDAFAALSESDHVSHLLWGLATAVRWEARHGRWEIARSIAKVAADPEIGQTNARLWADVLTWLARAEAELGDVRARDERLAQAVAVSRQIASEQLRTEALEDVRLAQAAVANDPRDALQLAATVGDVTRDPRRTIDAHLIRARALRRLDSATEARAELERAVRLIDQLEDAIANRDLRGAFAATHRTVFDELIDLLAQGGDRDAALRVAEQSRAEKWRRSGGTAARPRLANPPAGTALLSLYPLRDRVLADVITSTGRADATIPLRGGQLDLQTLSYERVIAPFERELARVSTLVIVVDGPLATFPFAALRDAHGRYLVEKWAIVRALTLDPAFGNDERGRFLLVRGDDRGMERLAAADRELSELATHAGAIVLTGHAATPENVLREIAAASWFHYSGHAVVNSVDAKLSHLRLARPLYVADIRASSSPSLQLAYLGGCSTAIAGGGSADPDSLATAFLAAGARYAIGTLWDVEDRAAAEMSRLFYGSLVRSGNPVTAAREAQLAMLRSGDRRLNTPEAWAAMQVYVRPEERKGEVR